MSRQQVASLAFAAAVAALIAFAAAYYLSFGELLILVCVAGLINVCLLFREGVAITGLTPAAVKPMALL